VKKRQQVTHRVRVARQVNAVRIPAVGHDRLPDGLVRRQPDRTDRVTCFKERCAEPEIVLQRPGPYRQQTAARIDQNQVLAFDCREVSVELGRNLLQLFLGKRQHRRRFTSPGDGVFAHRHGIGLDRPDQRQELERQMPVRVVEHRAVNERTPVKPFLIQKDDEGSYRLTVRKPRYNSQKYKKLIIIFSPSLSEENVASLSPVRTILYRASLYFSIEKSVMPRFINPLFILMMAASIFTVDF